MNNFLLLFFVIFLEGYVVLSAELLAMRIAIPYVGTGTDTISIIIAAVLMPLAVGYYAGGHFQKYKSYNGLVTVRKKLLRNIFTAALFFVIGLSYFSATFFFESLNQNGVQNRLLVTTIYAGVFLVIPVYLLAQTIPLVSHYFRKEKLSFITGKMLFFSTMGSFMGAVFSTLVLMAFIGVNYTVVVTIGCLALLYFMLSRKIFSKSSLGMVLIFIAAIAMNNKYVLSIDNVVAYNQYNMIQVKKIQDGNSRVLSVNKNNSSVYTDTSAYGEAMPYMRKTYGYVSYINRNFIDPIIGDLEKRDFLIIGAGGFTIGIDDPHNNYTFVDLDESLLAISEEHFLKKKLTKNKVFKAVPARAYINQSIRDGKKFDMVIADVFLGDSTIPEHLVTQEFYAGIRQILKKDGIMMANFIAPIDFSTKFSVKLDNTLRRVFPQINRQITKDYDGWRTEELRVANVLYIYYNREHNITDYYTDDMNRSYYDREKEVQ